MTLTKTASLAIEAPNNHNQRNHNHRHRRILFLSLEFNFAPFSGNGVLCRSLVSALLLSSKQQVDIRVICAKPHPSTPNTSSDITSIHKNLIIWPVELQESSQWKRLDRYGPWKEFAAACSCTNSSNNNSDSINNSDSFQQCIEQFEPTDVVAVDWHGMLAWQAICTTSQTNKTRWEKGLVNVCYYNFRVYSSSSWGGNNNSNDDDEQFYRKVEQLSCRLADGIICLSEHDKCALEKLMQDDDCCEKVAAMNSKRCQDSKRREITILPPPLRGDVCHLARMMKNSQPPPEEEEEEEEEEEGGGASSLVFDMHLPEKVKQAIHHIQTYHHHHHHPTTIPQKRLFITCISRLSPEKTPHIFINLLQQLGGVTFLRQHCLVPILCGAKSVDSYASKVIQSFHNLFSTENNNNDDDNEDWPYIIIDHHLGPQELAALFSYTVINIHPCLYDAYGMTLVESAAFGIPSVVNCGGKVGAAKLLCEGVGCVALDLSGLDNDEVEEDVSVDKKDEDGGDGMKCSVRMLKEMLAHRMMEHVDVGSPQRRRCSGMLAKVAIEARDRALGWDELSCCRGLVDKLNSLRRVE